MSNCITVNGRKICAEQPPYIISEVSANHNGSIENALKIIEMSAKAGADAVKIQTYRSDTITLKSDLPDFQITEGLWAGKTLFELYSQAYTPWEWHEELFNYARQIGITIFSSPFDKTAVDLLEDLNAPAYKIASFEIVDLPLIQYAASTGKPIIISTGMANVTEIQEAISAARDVGCKELAILHCVSGYPAPSSDYNLLTISDMIERFGVVTGLSDHTIDNTTAISSIALGASIIEKHVTLDRSGGGPDDSFSLEPNDLKALCRASEIAWEAIGKAGYRIQSSERGNVKFRRSLFVVKDISAGEKLTIRNVKSIRPGNGLAPKYLNSVLKGYASHDLEYGKPLCWSDVILPENDISLLQCNLETE